MNDTPRASFFEPLRIAVILAIAAFCVTLVFRERVVLQNMWEDLAFRTRPTAERAFQIGEKHFNARTPDLYDVSRANYYFLAARKLDSKFPSVNHELARIAFLRGDMIAGLEYIDLELQSEKPDPASYYVRALIHGFREEYLAAAKDYEEYFKIAPANWAAINDYSWVLLKSDLPEAALEALDWGIKGWPENPWLLNNRTTALYELGRFAAAYENAKRASQEVQKVTEADWLNAYPGNDPLSSRAGLESFRKAVADNLLKAKEAAEKGGGR